MTTPIESHYGSRTIYWDGDTLESVLRKLRRERKSIAARYQMPDNGADTAGLIAEAVCIKDSANHILEADRTQ